MKTEEPIFDIADRSRNVALSSRVELHPGMITRGERQALQWLASHHYTGAGHIVDAGIFLGASTVALVAGLRENIHQVTAGVGNKPVLSFDIARWVKQGFDQYLATPAEKALVGGRLPDDGEDFSPLLEQLLNPESEMVEFHWGDILMSRPLAPNTRIEIAFFDLLKNQERDWFAFSHFGPHYIPGHTVVVHQDYFYEGALSSKIRQESLTEYFDFLGAVETSSFWLLKKKIPRRLFERDAIMELDDNLAVAYLEIAARRTPLSKHQLSAEIGVVDYWRSKQETVRATKKLLEILSRSSSVPRSSRLGQLIESRIRILGVDR